MISSVPPPIGPSRASRTARSSSGGASSPWIDRQASIASNAARCVRSFASVTSRTTSSPATNRRSAAYVIARPASIVTAISARRWRSACWDLRVRTNSSVCSKQTCIAPIAPSAITRRSHWKLAMIR